MDSTLPHLEVLTGTPIGLLHGRAREHIVSDGVTTLTRSTSSRVTRERQSLSTFGSKLARNFFRVFASRAGAHGRACAFAIRKAGHMPRKRKAGAGDGCADLAC